MINKLEENDPKDLLTLIQPPCLSETIKHEFHHQHDWKETKTSILPS